MAEISAKPALAVLPFVSQSDSAARDFFADGLTRDLISALSRFSAVTVMSYLERHFTLQGQACQPREVGRALRVRYQVEGRVHQTSDRVRVGAQLVDTHGRVLWSARFDEAPC
jgi:TolB-like protein